MILQKLRDMIHKVISTIAKRKLHKDASNSDGLQPNSKKDISNFTNKALNILLYGGVGLATWKLGIKPAIDRYKANKATEKIYDDPNYQQASALHQAIRGSGTDEDTVFETARAITDWKSVQKAYSQLTKGNNLDTDLKKDLTDSEYYSFMRIVGKNTETESKQGYIVISKKEIRLRNTPDSSTGTFSFNTNILAVVDKRKLLGFATGRKKVDDHGVLYYEVRIKYLKGIPKYHQRVYQKQKSRILTYWVGAGAIDMYREFKQMRSVYPSVKIYTGTKDTGLRQILKN